LDQIALAHISDTHFGGTMNHNQWQVTLPGKCYHDVILCLALSNAVRYVRRTAELADDERLHVIHSGDLTNSGRESEFQIGHTFMRSRWCYRRDQPVLVGLAGNSESTAVVPGNHDHMNGQYPFVAAYNPRIIGKDFRRTAWKKTAWRSSQRTFQVEVYGLDSNSGLGAGTNLRARGKIAEREFDEIEQSLSRSTADIKIPTVRVLVVHHSIAYVGGAVEQRTSIKMLDEESRIRIVKIAQAHRVTAILTGHTHDFFYGNVGTDIKPVWELRSAATLQGPVVQRANSSHSAQGFWLHQVAIDNKELFWSGWRFQWNGNGFYPMQKTPCIRLPAQVVSGT
jgi:3',5'-cyclic AMP phosphodiesterase CpdA